MRGIYKRIYGVQLGIRALRGASFWKALFRDISSAQVIGLKDETFLQLRGI